METIQFIFQGTNQVNFVTGHGISLYFQCIKKQNVQKMMLLRVIPARTFQDIYLDIYFQVSALFI